MWVTKECYVNLPEEACNYSFFDISYKHEENGWYYPLHSHEYYEAIFCVSGYGKVTINSTTIDIEKGMIMIMKPHSFHSFWGAEKSDFGYCVLSFYADPQTEVGKFFIDNPYILASMHGNIDFVFYCHKLNQEIYNNGYSKKAPLFYAVCVQLLEMVRYAFTKYPIELPTDTNTTTNQILDYINQHFNEEIDLHTLAKEFGLSVAHLSRIFKQAYNISPINYLIDYRMVIAKDALSTTDRDVKDISESVGYQNVNHFSRLFLKRVHMSPIEYRKKHRQISANIKEASMRDIMSIINNNRT